MPENVPGFKYRDDYSPQLPPLNRTRVDADDDEEIELGLHTAEDEEISSELKELYNSFQVGHIRTKDHPARIAWILIWNRFITDMY